MQAVSPSCPGFMVAINTEHRLGIAWRIDHQGPLCLSHFHVALFPSLRFRDPVTLLGTPLPGYSLVKCQGSLWLLSVRDGAESLSGHRHRERTRPPPLLLPSLPCEVQSPFPRPRGDTKQC